MTLAADVSMNHLDFEESAFGYVILRTYAGGEPNLEPFVSDLGGVKDGLVNLEFMQPPGADADVNAAFENIERISCR